MANGEEFEMTFDQIWSEIGPHSLLGEPRSRVLYNLLKLAPAWGYLVEVGVYQGYTAKLMQMARPINQLHLFDTFCGIKKSDVSIDKHSDGDFICDRASVEKLFDPKDLVTFHEGLFPDEKDGSSFSQTISFVHSDTDTYYGTRSTLEEFWDHMTPRGILLFDDYKFDPCPGVEKALTEWSEITGVEIMESPSGGQAWVIKP